MCTPAAPPLSPRPLRRSALAVALIALLTLGAGGARAHEAELGDIGLPTVSVPAHYDNAVGTSDAASQGVATPTLIANRPSLRPGEILEFVPGMIVTQHSGDGKANQYFLRGFNLDHGTDFATFVDGMPVNMRSHAHGQGYTDLNFLIPELVSSIRYRKGPYFAEEGDFSSAGAARMSLSNSLPAGIASATVGEHGYRRALLADSVHVQPFRQTGHLLYAIEAGRNDGPWDNPERLKKFNGVLRYSHGDAENGMSLTAMAYRSRWNATDQIPLRAVESGALGRYGAVDPSDGGAGSRYSLSWNYGRRDAQEKFTASAYYIKSRLDLFSNFTYFQTDPANGDQFQQSERRALGGFAVANTWFTTLGGLEMQNTLGVQGRQDRLGPIGLYATAAREKLATVREDRVRESSLGFYAENATQWLPWLRSVAGLRHDEYKFDVSSDDPANSGKLKAGIRSPKFSLIFGPWARTEYFVNWGKGFHSNDARGVTQTVVPGGGGPTEPAKPLVVTRGGEIGVRSEIVPGLQSSLALWRLDIDSELVFVGDAGATEPSRASRRRGIEWNNHWIARPWLLFDLDLSASKARYRDEDAAGNFIPGALDKVAAFGVTVTELGRWYGGLQVRYFGPRPLIEDGSVMSKATALAYARVGYKIDAKTRIGVDVFNLFDRRASDIDYWYASQLRGEAVAMDDVHFHPVEPRSLRLTVTHNF